MKVSNMELHAMRIQNLHSKIDSITSYMGITPKTKIVYLEKIIKIIKTKELKK